MASQENGLLPLLSGLGVPRASPLSQSGAIIRFLARRYGLDGADELQGLEADVLYETAKDLKSHKAEVCVGDSPLLHSSSAFVWPEHGRATKFSEEPNPNNVSLVYALLEARGFALPLRRSPLG